VKEVDKVDDEIVEEYDMKWFKKRDKCKREDVCGDKIFWERDVIFIEGRSVRARA
jgi:hypothetical protein